MATPVMISNISWGTYLFFAVVNFLFIPVIYFFYPETKKRSLEEIDIIFAKAYTEKISYVKASFDLPFLTDREVEQKAREYGFQDKDEEYMAGEKIEEQEKGSLAPERSDSEGTLHGVEARDMAHRPSGQLARDEQEGGFRND